MNALRDLYVGIHFEDNATRNLKRVEDTTDDIRDNFRGMSADLAGVSAGFGQFGMVGSQAADGVEDAIDDLKDEVRNLADQIALLALTSEAAFAKMEDDIEDAEDEMEDLGRETSRTIAKVTLLGATLTAVFGAGVAASAPLLAGIGALAASFGAAGMGAAAFGAVAIPILSDIFKKSEEIEKLQEKIANADSAKERIKAQKELAAVYAEMSKEQRFALKELQSFKDFWAGFAKQFENPVFNAFGLSLHIIQELFKGLGPTIKNVADVTNELLETFDQFISGGGFKEFFGWLEINAAESLYNFAHILGNTFMGVMNLLQAFAPLGASIEEGLVRMTQRFQEWSASLSQSTAFQSFVEYAKTNGPILLSIIGNIATIFKNLVTDLAPLGTTVLSGLQSITGLIANNWPVIRETVIGLTTAFVAFKTAMFGMTVIQTATTLLQAYRAGTLAATLAQWGFNTALWANPATWVAAGIAALVAIGVVLYRNWDTIKAKAIELWNRFTWIRVAAIALLGPFGAVIAMGVALYRNWDTIKAKASQLGATIAQKWAAIRSATSSAWNSVKSAISSAMASAKSSVSNFFGGISGWIESAKAKWNSFVSALKNFRMPKIGLPKWMGGKGLIQVPGHATGLSRVPYDNYLARLHKDETVLRADQSRALEEAGILDRSGATPQINPLGAASTASPKTATGGNISIEFSPKVDIHVTGADVKSAGSLEKAVAQKLDEMWQMFLDIYATEVVL
jgi:hypothetical protein